MNNKNDIVRQVHTLREAHGAWVRIIADMEEGTTFLELEGCRFYLFGFPARGLLPRELRYQEDGKTVHLHQWVRLVQALSKDEIALERANYV